MRKLATEPGDFVWVGLHEPNEDELGDVAEEFGLHPLAVEDAFTAHQRPKLERYERQRCSSPSRRSGTSTRTTRSRPARSTCSSADDFVITVRHGSGSELHTRPARPRGQDRRAHPRTLRGRVRRVRPGRRRLPDGGGCARGGRRRGRDLGLLRPAHQRLRPHLHRSSARSPRCAARCCRCASRCGASPTGAVPGIDEEAGAVLPRRRSTTSTGSPRPSTASTRCCPPPSTPTWPGSRSSRTRTCARSPPASALVAVPTLIAGVYGMNFDHMPELQLAATATPSRSP